MSEFAMRDGSLKRTVKFALQMMTGLVGYDPLQSLAAARGIPLFVRTAREYASRPSPASLRLRWRDLYPMCTDFTASAGTASGHYFHQDLWAARKVHLRHPERHVDIGSRVDGFVAHLLVFTPVDVVDIRPLKSTVAGLRFVQADAVRLERFKTDSVESLSSLHAVEHFGLGRYGDPVDPEACFVAIESLIRVLKPGGHLYFSVPIGRERLEFNAHRVFSPDTILDRFNKLSLLSFAAVNDAGDYCEGTSPAVFRDARYACGLFEFTKTAR